MTLDQILELVREPMPDDEMFVRHVARRMAPPRSRRPLRAAALGALAVAAVTSGAAVAALIADAPPEPTRERSLVSPGSPATAPPRSLPARALERKRESPLRTASAPARRPEPIRDASQTSSVVDTATGLRLELRVPTERTAAGRPVSITLALENAGDEPVVVLASESCALYVRGTGPDGSDQRSCAGPLPAVLAPGDTSTQTVSMVLGSSGDWQLLGVCACVPRDPDAVPKTDVSDDLRPRALWPGVLDARTPHEVTTPGVALRAL